MSHGGHRHVASILAGMVEAAPFDPPVDLGARRARADAAIRAVAAAPVRFVPDELLIALQGSWGDPEPAAAPVRLRIAR